MKVFQPTTLEVPSGARLQVYCSDAPAPRGVVQINHGLAEHAARYERFASFLAEQGFHAVAHDHRGHGHTRAPHTSLGRFATKDGAERVVDDAQAVFNWTIDRYPGLPILVFGHSMGGLIALNLAMRRPGGMHGLAVWNTNTGTAAERAFARAVLWWERFRLGSDVPSHLLPRLTFGAWARAIPSRRTEFDWLSRDEGEVAAYVADPLCGWNASVSLWQDIVLLMSGDADDHGQKQLPPDLMVQLVGGAADPATEGGRAVRRLGDSLKRNGCLDVQTTIYPDIRHESLNELNRNIIMSDFVAWADKTVKVP